MGIHTVEDLLLYLPRAHEDLTAMGSIATAAFGEKVTIRGAVTNLKLVYTRTRKRLVTAVFTDGEGGSADVVWFNQPHVMRMLAEGQEVVLTGKLAEDGRRLIFQSPQFELGGRRELLHAGRLVPIYPQHDIISTKWLREKMVLVRDAIDAIPETLPPSVLEEEKLLPRSHMVKALHFPDDPSHVQAALDRMAFEEMFAVQRTALERRQAWQGATQDRLKIPMDVELIKAFFASLKFTPTGSQKIAIYEILRDLERPIPMSRLLEGDVGSGKTLVAVAVMATVVKAGGQCALMVPTEVLSRQHAETITRLLLNFHSYLHTNPSVLLPLPRVALLTGSTPPADARDIRDKLCGGMIDIVIGTHALIEESVQFKDLRLVIVDEQHRFGVLQRQRLTEKGSPHFLSMTATPIPRTLALTAYGDHDLSVLLEKPGNRKPIRTKVVAPKDRKTVELFIDREIEDGRQAFVICPLITGSESEEIRDVKSVEEESKRLSEAFPRRRVSMLHGRMSGKEKDDIMRRFKDRQSDILVSTSVIEVGIDVPNSTIIVIEGAERFGLAQLHQFRGRVGRGEHQSHCFLFATTPEQARSPRLKAMEEYDSGFQLAEIDLKLRGPGELYGVRQSGIPESAMMHLLNPELVVRARRAAEKMLGMAPSVV
jgi:ATP-dependent DNA helicase RecG